MPKPSGATPSSRTRRAPIARQQRFLRALDQATAHRRQFPAWVSIHEVARLMRLAHHDAVLLCHECEIAGLVFHDLSSEATSHRHEHAAPHSVAITASGAAALRQVRRSR